MKLKVTMTVILKEEGMMAFFKNMVIKQVIKSASETVIENEMMKVNINNIEEVK